MQQDDSSPVEQLGHGIKLSIADLKQELQILLHDCESSKSM